MAGQFRKQSNRLFVSTSLAALLMQATPAMASATSAPELRYNQLGYLPGAEKIAVVLAEDKPQNLELRSVAGNDAALKKEIPLRPAAKPTWSGETAWIADFSTLRTPGRYQLAIPGGESMGEFSIRQGLYADLANASLKAFYFQRASTALDKQHAGIFARAMGHPDDRVLVHASAATESRPEGTVIASPKGWYDAGDYNKYVVNSGITLGTLLGAFERYPAYFTAQDLNIPESGNDLPDILDEAHYNLTWLITMQDPADGGVYHKLTTANFSGMVDPAEATAQRYVIQKSTAATLDFAAVMAQAARVYRPYRPELAGRYLQAAEKAWQWAEQNPAVIYRQDELNEKFDPDVTTGAYGDEQLQDERAWAAAELLVTTGNADNYKPLANADTDFQLPSWSQVKWLGIYSLVLHQEKLHKASPASLSALEEGIIAEATRLIDASHQYPYRAAIGSNKNNFIWGSNAVAANQGILFLEAYRISGERHFLQGAIDTLDYLLGRNATGYAYITGFGHKPPQHPHHRLAAAHPQRAPLPGFLAGGPNPAQQDQCDYPSDIADASYVDDVCSYASNEIAINWNAPLAYLANGVQATLSEQEAEQKAEEKAKAKVGARE